MLTHRMRGCAYVRMGAWSYLLNSKHNPRFSFWLNGCHLLAKNTINLLIV